MASIRSGQSRFNTLTCLSGSSLDIEFKVADPPLLLAFISSSDCFSDSGCRGGLPRPCRRFPDVQELILREMGEAPSHGEIGNGRGRADNIRSTSDYGTSATHALRRLKRDAPELAERVITGEPARHVRRLQRCRGDRA